MAGSLSDTRSNSIHKCRDWFRYLADTDTRIVLQQAPGEYLSDIFEHGRSLINRGFEQLLHNVIDVLGDFCLDG